MDKCHIFLLMLVTMAYLPRCSGHLEGQDLFYRRHQPLYNAKHGRDTPTPYGCDLNVLYDPVCATNGATFANMQALQCWNKMNPNKNIEALAFRKCGPLKCATYDAMSPKIRGRPFKPLGANVLPVCASNGLTYDSIDQVHCIFKYFPNITIRHEGGCTVHEVRKIFGNKLKHQACSLAVRRYEWNPVCTTKNITYANPFVLLCRHLDVGSTTMGECGSFLQKSCLAARNLNKELTNTNKRKYLVCGSDGKTYRSIMHLKCSSQLNNHLRCQHKGPCTKNHDTCAAAPRFIWNSGQPVCGSDGLTYITPMTLYCSKHTYSPKLKYLHSGSCLPAK